MKEIIGDFLKKTVWCGIVLILFLRCIIEFWLLQHVDINDFSQIRLIEGRANHIIEVLIFVTFLFFFIYRFLHRKPLPFDIYIDGALLGITFLALVSFTYTLNLDASLQAFLELASLICLFYIVSVLTEENRLYKDFIILLIIIAISISFYGIRQYFVIFPFLESSGMLDNVTGIGKSMVILKRVGSVFGWPNKLSGFLCIYIPLTIGVVSAYFFAKYKSKRCSGSINSKFHFLIIFLMFMTLVILILCMVFTYSIGGWLALFGALLIQGTLVLIIFGMDNFKQFVMERKVAFVIVTACVVLTCILLVGNIVQKRANIYTSNSISSRSAYLKWSVRLVKDNPVLGTGIGTFKTAYAKYVPSGSSTTKHAHNSYLEMWAEIGIMGFLLFMLFIFQLLRKGIQAIVNNKSTENKLLIIGVFSGVCAFLIHNGIEFTFYVHSVSLYWWFAVGLLVSRTRPNINSKNISKAFAYY